ncbi:hypothetical protein BSBH6_02814 [Bacillus subtilis]|nr:hypothetical protein BSBH6_02814 [Bacillus subtilis]RPK23780.1 hypothetical protein BH5_02811 [Bacillus subtilis]
MICDTLKPFVEQNFNYQFTYVQKSVMLKNILTKKEVCEGCH